MADTSKYIKVPWSFLNHAKTEELSDAAIGQLLKAWLYSASSGTDGRLTATQVKKRFSPKVLRELLAVGFIYEDVLGFELHEWATHQMTQARLDEIRTRAKAAGAAGGTAKAAYAQARASDSAVEPIADAYQPPSNPLAVASQSASAAASEPLAVAKQTPSDLSSESLPVLALVLEEELTTKNSCPPRATSDAIRLAEDFYAKYPRKAKRPLALKAFASATRRADPEVILAGLQRWLTHAHCPEPGYWPYPASWLNGDQWNDEPKAPKNGSPSRPASNNYPRQPGERKVMY